MANEWAPLAMVPRPIATLWAPAAVVSLPMAVLAMPLAVVWLPIAVLPTPLAAVEVAHRGAVLATRDRAVTEGRTGEHSPSCSC